MSERQYKTVHFTLNGKPTERNVDVRASLTDMLRNDYRMTSVKKGCEVGECGACTVIINGEAFDSCIYLGLREKKSRRLKAFSDRMASFQISRKRSLKRQRSSAASVRPDLSSLPGRS